MIWEREKVMSVIRYHQFFSVNELCSRSPPPPLYSPLMCQSAEEETLLFVYAQFIMAVLLYKFTSDIEIIEVSHDDL